VEFPVGGSITRMSLRPLIVADLSTLDWNAVEDGHWRIVADVTCASCGAYQAADSDPLRDKEIAKTLCVRLFNSTGWRVANADQLLCPNCASRRVAQVLWTWGSR